MMRLFSSHSYPLPIRPGSRQPQPCRGSYEQWRDDELAILHLQARHSVLEFAIELLKLDEYEGKAGFRQDQPRWPRGSGDQSGRWSGGAGTAEPDTSPKTGPTRGGHHFVSKKIYEGLPLRPDTKRVFEQAVTGTLRAGPHGWSKEHETYNNAVAEQLNRFMRENGVRPENMTPEQARKFVDQVKRTSDPRIRNLNMRIYMREIMYWLRRAPPRGTE